MAFWQLTVASSPESTDGLTNFLWEQGALGVVEEETPPEPPRLRAFFPETASSTALMTAVRAYCASLRSLGLSGAAAEPEISPLLDAAWASAWQQSFPPRAIGERLLVRPPWEADLVANGRLVIIIEPGRAFGTGHHGSTEGCLVLLERALAGRSGARVLDIGTGSGILAVAAVKLGAISVLGIDVDPDATSAAHTNAERNGCEDRIEITLAGPETLTGEAFPVAVANLLTHTHLALAPIYARLVAPGGALVLGGILAEEDPQVTGALEAVGFIQRDRLVLEGWSSLRLDRLPASRP
jgi:ribosomal protein L11 methyltransferase